MHIFFVYLFIHSQTYLQSIACYGPAAFYGWGYSNGQIRPQRPCPPGTHILAGELGKCRDGRGAPFRSPGRTDFP